MEQDPAPSDGAPGRARDGSRRAPEECLLCTATEVGPVPAPNPAGPPGADADEAVVAFVDDDLVALVEPGVPGVLVAPRAHVEGLATAPREGAVVLGALRRAASTVQSSYLANGTAIEPTMDLPTAPGHICYRIVPVRDDQPLPPGSYPDLDSDLLALALRRAASTGTPPPG